MFEKYDIDNVYFGTVEDFGIVVGMENFGGCLNIWSTDESKYYDTLLYKTENGYIDLYNRNRIINSEMVVPTEKMPIISKNHHMYTICEDSLVNYRDKVIIKDAKTLKRGFFNKYKLM